MAVSVQITFDCRDPDRLARFWAELLGYRLQPPPEGHATWEDFLRSIGVPEERWGGASAIIDPDGRGPRVYFQRVPEGKTVKNRVHLDVNAGGGRAMDAAERRRRVDEMVERAVALGARRLGEHEDEHERWVTLADPEGDEFCVQ